MNLDQLSQLVFSSLPIRKKTLATYKSMYRCHVEAKLGQTEIEDINRSDIKILIVGLPPQTAMMTLAVVKVLFREALELGLLEKSPVHGVKGPKVMVQPRRFLTWDELEAMDFGKYTKQVKFLALHGLRWGEAVALTPSDIRDGKIFVNKSIHGATKSRAGMRVIPLVSEFVPLPRHPRTLRKALAPHGITIHSLRHTYAYILKRQGIHVTTAQRLLGHSDPKVTLAVYTQVLDNEIDEAGDILKVMVGRAHSSEMRMHIQRQFALSA
jgi:integrase